MSEANQIELRSEEFQEVLGTSPPWILRCGILVLAVIVGMLLLGSWYIKYPDTITATMVLTGNTPPAGVVARSNGHLKELIIRDGQYVEEDSFLGVIENPASTDDILWLKQKIEILLQDPESAVDFPYRDLKLGAVQVVYVSFLRSLRNYRQLIEQNYYPQKMAIIREKIRQHEQHYLGMKSQHTITNQQYELAQTKYRRDSLLRARRVISDQDLDNATNQLLQSRMILENAVSTLENLQIQMTQLSETLLDTEKQYADSKNSSETELNALSIQLKNEIKTWEMNYALMAPISGKVTFTSFWSENQQITVGETVFTIVPDKEISLTGKAMLPVARSGKVKTGQQVNIRFLNYPDNEFGIVKGTVKTISLVPVKDHYAVEVDFPQGLKTTYKKELPFSQEMAATIEIITEDLRLLERFVLPLKKVIRN